MKPNFQAMTKAELKRYVIQHRTDDDAFHALMDKVKAEPNPVWYSIEDADRIADIIPGLHDRSEMPEQ